MKCNSCVYFDGTYCGCDRAEVWFDDLNDCPYYESEEDCNEDFA